MDKNTLLMSLVWTLFVALKTLVLLVQTPVSTYVATNNAKIKAFACFKNGIFYFF